MFTGIVQGMAQVASLVDQPGLRTITLQFPPGFCQGLEVGASVAVDGVCLTVTRVQTANATNATNAATPTVSVHHPQCLRCLTTTRNLPAPVSSSRVFRVHSGLSHSRRHQFVPQSNALQFSRGTLGDFIHENDAWSIFLSLF